MKLEIVIITYNRSTFLSQTLDYFIDSCVSKYKITVLDNGSTDNTRIIADQYVKRFLNMSVITHKNNIGLGANIIRAFEIAEADYTWVVCDDDKIDLNDFSDVIEIIEEGKVELIHIGGHYQDKWSQFGGQLRGIKDFVAAGYPYFKFSSFLPTNIVLTKLFQKNYLIPGYANVVNAYPHMPYLLDAYQLNKKLYISKVQNVIAKVGGQSYNEEIWFLWWMKTCELLLSKHDIRLAFIDQWNEIGYNTESIALEMIYYFSKKNPDMSYLKHFIKVYFTESDIDYLKSLNNREKIGRIKNKAKEMFPALYERAKALKK